MQWHVLHQPFLHEGQLLRRRSDVNREVNRVSHVRTPVVVHDGQDGELAVGIVDLEVVVSEEDRRQDVHLLDDHLKDPFILVDQLS